MTGSFAIYRLPRRDRLTLVQGSTVILENISDAAGAKGFVIAPFDPARYPVVVINPDDVAVLDTPADIPALSYWERGSDNVRSDYKDDFSRSMALLREGALQKVVLARCVTEPRDATTPGEMFAKACSLYPDAFVALFSTDHTGTWLVATPELLLGRDGDRWHTMALAGTITTPDADWSDKNRQEQQLVDRYIADTLGKYTADVRQSGPAPARAGALTHLRTDFDFSLREEAFGALLDALHPTPAVCGLPKLAAYSEIVHHQSCDREYYSGFSGPVGIDGDIRLYVSLRCMRIDTDTCVLFAGGGLLPQSDYDNEYAETDSKMETMRRVMR